MEISRFDAGAESVHAEEVDVAALVRATVRARGWDDRVRLEGDGLRVTSDPRRLERIVANLVDNALEHGGSSASRCGSARTRSEVADDGPGDPARAPAARLRALLQGRRLPQRRRHRPRPRDRAGERDPARRRARGRERARRRAAASRSCCLWQNRYATVTATLRSGSMIEGVKPQGRRHEVLARHRPARRTARLGSVRGLAVVRARESSSSSTGTSSRSRVSATASSCASTPRGG